MRALLIPLEEGGEEEDGEAKGEEMEGGEEIPEGAGEGRREEEGEVEEYSVEATAPTKIGYI